MDRAACFRLQSCAMRPGLRQNPDALLRVAYESATSVFVSIGAWPAYSDAMRPAMLLAWGRSCGLSRSVSYHTFDIKSQRCGGSGGFDKLFPRVSEGDTGSHPFPIMPHSQGERRSPPSCATWAAAIHPKVSRHPICDSGYGTVLVRNRQRCLCLNRLAAELERLFCVLLSPSY